MPKMCGFFDFQNASVLDTLGSAQQEPSTQRDIVAPYFGAFDLECYYFMYRQI